MNSDTVRQTFRDVLAQAAEQARALLPASTNGRIESAVKLVLSGDVFFCDDGTVQVGGSDPTRYYRLVGSTCTCTDFVQEKAPQGMCKHRIAANLHKSVERVLARRAEPETEPEPVDPEMLEASPDNDPEAGPEPQPETPEPPAAIDSRHIVTIQGKPFVKFAGLLDMAHKRGLQSLTVDWSYNDSELSLAHAVAVFPFGTFAESGDATPANVNKKVAPHFRRCALTRAAARCLRLALGLDMVAVEELADE